MDPRTVDLETALTVIAHALDMDDSQVSEPLRFAVRASIRIYQLRGITPPADAEPHPTT